jgi:hypothetical protein
MNSDQYRLYGAACLRLAKLASNASDRLLLLHMADAGQQLAERGEFSTGQKHATGPEANLSFRQHGRGFDLDSRFVFDKRRHLDHGHGREMFPHHAAISFADFTQSRHIFGLIGDEPSEPRNVFRRATRLSHDRDDILESLADLGDKVLAFEFSVRVPSYLAGDKNRPSFGNDSICVAYRRLPMSGV